MLGRALVVIFMALAVILTILPWGCDDERTTQKIKNFVEKKPPRPSKPVLSPEGAVYDFLESMFPAFRQRYSYYEAEARLYMEASKKFNIPVVEIYRAYTLRKNKISGKELSDSEIDYAGIKHLQDIGFYREGEGWYYMGESVNMGNSLPAPDYLEKPTPDFGREIQVSLNIQTVIYQRMIQVKGHTNLPEETELVVRVSSQALNYFSEDLVKVKEGEFVTTWFTKSRKTGEKLLIGTYALEVYTPSVSFMPVSVREVLGPNGSNMIGELVSYNTAVGNQVRLKQTVQVK